MSIASRSPAAPVRRSPHVSITPPDLRERTRCSPTASLVRRISAAAGAIAAALTEAGFAVLRFDFTGLGQSDGEFANTDFTSNAVDLVLAADWLRAEYRAPQLLVGHSLGGAAVIAVAADIPEVSAVATIGAPADPSHVVRLFDGRLDEIAADGAAAVSIAGREFMISREFIDDLRSQRILDLAGGLGAALMVLHSPTDEVVSIEHAGRLFSAASHPRSYVSLDGADHLLTDHGMAQYAARTIATFAAQYSVDESGVLPAPRSTNQVVVAETSQGAFLNHVVIGNHQLLADEPESVGGFDAGPAPYDFLAAALGSCTSMTIRMYADRKQLPLDRVAVEVSHAKVHLDDCVECVDSDHLRPIAGRVDRFERVVTLTGDELTDANRTRLLEIADRCPVHRTLEATSVIATRLA